MKKFIVRFIREEEGQDVIEYTLLGAFISIVAIVAITNVGTDVTALFERDFTPHFSSCRCRNRPPTRGACFDISPSPTTHR